MMLTRYRIPVAPFTELRREMDRLLDDSGMCGITSPFRRVGVYPALNVWDEGEALCVEVEVPGLKRDELEIFATENELTIKGRRLPNEDEKRTYHRQERSTGEFTRVITLPVEVDSGKVEARLENGVLSLRLPKVKEILPRKITVKTT